MGILSSVTNRFRAGERPQAMYRAGENRKGVILRHFSPLAQGKPLAKAGGKSLGVNNSIMT
jgi:hypothetical protein